MATPSEKLAQSLEVLHMLQDRGARAIRTRDLTRTHRERLIANGLLREVMKGWYIPSNPDEATGDSTSWYTLFWDFFAAYLKVRFGTHWCLSPEQSLSLHAGNRSVPDQLLVRSPKARNKVTDFPHGTSLLDVRSSLPDTVNMEQIEGLQVFGLASALISCSPRYFLQNPTDARTALSMVRDASDVLAQLLEGGRSTIAGRLAGAFRNIGRTRAADDIVKTMRAVGYDVRECDPFEKPAPLILTAREVSPYVNRIRLMWQNMRGSVMNGFPPAPRIPTNIETYLQHLKDAYVRDAYHSLSIEGYRVSPALIERVRTGVWNPDDIDGDRDHRNALAARGY